MTAPADWRTVEAQLVNKPGIAVQLLVSLRAAAAVYAPLFSNGKTTTLVESEEYSEWKSDLTSSIATMSGIMAQLGASPPKAQPNASLPSQYNAIRGPFEAAIKASDAKNYNALDGSTRRLAILLLVRKSVRDFDWKRQYIADHYGEAGTAEASLARAIDDAETWLELQG